jgi:hypothetical protein
MGTKLFSSTGCPYYRGAGKKDTSFFTEKRVTVADCWLQLAAQRHFLSAQIPRP